MATDDLGGRPLPFNIPTGVDALKARDAEFWRLHACWRLAETEFEAWDGFPDQCALAAALFARADELRNAMLSCPVRTGSALAMKLEAVREGDWGSILSELPCRMTVAEVIEGDVGRISKGEIWSADAFQDMAEG